MASPTQWAWVWVNSGSWWWTERPGLLQSMGLQRVGHDWVTEQQQQSKRLCGSLSRQPRDTNTLLRRTRSELSSLGGPIWGHICGTGESWCVYETQQNSSNLWGPAQPCGWPSSFLTQGSKNQGVGRLACHVGVLTFEGRKTRGAAGRGEGLFSGSSVRQSEQSHCRHPSHDWNPGWACVLSDSSSLHPPVTNSCPLVFPVAGDAPWLPHIAPFLLVGALD